MSVPEVSNQTPEPGKDEERYGNVQQQAWPFQYYFRRPCLLLFHQPFPLYLALFPEVRHLCLQAV